MVQRIGKEEDGYTLVEVLVAITIISIVLGIASTVFVFANGQLSRWSSDVAYYNNLHIAQSQIYKDVMRADEVVFTDSSLVVQMGEREKRYNWVDGRVHLNGIDLSDSENEIDSMYIRLSNVDQQVESSSRKMSWKVVQVSSSRKIEISQIVQARNPLYWKPVVRE
jgi:prepilin-type N-terminal cleavage/methylation domain-containing protein|tara:strand:- start:11316 stop:11813 length:498 start_codon:yes stop_codon:yes gene_type:complete